MLTALAADAAPGRGAAGVPARIYLPVRLDPQANRHWRRTMERLYAAHLSRAEASLLVIADDPRAYDHILSGRVRSVEAAFAKARRQAVEVLRISVQARRRHPEVRNNIVCQWHDMAARDGFRQVQRRLRQCLNADAEIAETFRDAAGMRAEISGWKPDNETVCWQERNLIDEAAMSLYVTEVLGYWKEMRAAPGEAGGGDPLSFLYDARRDQIRWLAGRPRVRRQLEFLDLEAGPGPRS